MADSEASVRNEQVPLWMNRVVCDPHQGFQTSPSLYHLLLAWMFLLDYFAVICLAAEILPPTATSLIPTWMLSQGYLATIWFAATLLVPKIPSFFLAWMLSLGCSATIWVVAELLTHTDLFLAWILSQGCFGTIWAAAGIFSLTAFFLIFSVVGGVCAYSGSSFLRSEGGAREQRRIGFRPEGDRPIARQDQASVWRKLQALRDFYLGIMNVRNGQIVRLLSLSPPGGIKMRTRAGRPFWCPTLLVAGIVACLPLIGASSTSASGSSTSGKPSFYQIMFLVSVGAGVFAVILTFIFGCLGIWRGRGDDVRGVVKELTHPLGERLGGTYMTVKSVKVGKAKVKGITYDSRPSPAYGAVHEPSLVYEPSAASGSAYELSSV